MLPGFRVLLATILLSTSVLVFGLGAAALLRAAHREFANLPSQRASETTFAQQDDAGRTLAMLQVDAPAPSETAFAEPADEAQPGAEAEEPTAVVPATEAASAAEAENIAMRSDAEQAPPVSEPAEDLPSGAPTQEVQVQEAAPFPVVEPAPADLEVTQTASADSTVATPTQPDASVSGPSSAETPAPSIRPAAKIKNSKPSKKRAAVVVKKPPASVKKPAAAKQVLVRRRVAPRPRMARPAPPQPAPAFASPFGGWDNQGAASGRAGKTAFGF